MNIMIENSDFFEEGLLEVSDVLLSIVQKEERTFEDNHRIRNIIDDLDSFNMSFIIEEMDMITYMTLLSMRNISIGIIPNGLCFKSMDFPNDEIEKEYERLLTLFVEIQKELSDKYNLSDKYISYLEPNSRLVDVKVSLSIKELFYFFLTCAKYDETLDIVVTASNNNIMEKLITIAMSIPDIINVDDLFIRMKLDETNRSELLDVENNSIKIISDEEYIDYCMKHNDYTIKLSSMGSCSMIAYREIIENIPKQCIKIENMYDFIDQEQFRISLPSCYVNISEDLSNVINGYIYDWYVLVNELKKFNNCEYIQMLCSLGCFSHVFRMNMPIYNYFEIDLEDLTTETKEMFLNIQQIILK